MEDSMRALFVLGRAMFGGFFAYNGVNHFRNQKMMSQYAEAKGVLAAEAAVPATGALLLAGGLSIMAGLKPKHARRTKKCSSALVGGICVRSRPDLCTIQRC